MRDIPVNYVSQRKESVDYRTSSLYPFSNRNDVINELLTPALIKYYQACERFCVEANASLSIFFANPKMHHLVPDKGFGLQDLLPFEHVISESDQLHSLDLFNMNLGPMMIPVLGRIIAKRDSIIKLNISYNYIGDLGAEALSKYLAQCKSLRTLKMRGNHITCNSVDSLAKAIIRNKSLKYLDISNNYLGSDGSILIAAAASEKNDPDFNFLTDGNFVFEEVINSVTHGFGILLSIIGTIVLLNHAGSDEFPPSYFWSCLVFGLSLISLYTCSTLAHSFHRMKRTVRVFMILDHSCISLLIAGTYTPFCLVSMGHSWIGWITCLTAWCGALACVYVSFLGPAYQKLEISLFIGLGWAVLFVMPWLYECLASAYLLVLGGIMYVGGVPFFIRGNTEPIYHAIWHVFVMLGSTCHYFSIFWDVRPCVALQNQ